MKRLLLTLCLTTALHAQQPAAEPTPHTFTSTDGRKLTATIIEKTATTVTIRRAEDGMDFTLPLDRLSAADQALVKAWGTKPTPPASGATTSPGGLVKTWMLEPQWDGVGLFGDGLAPVKLGGKWGFIDETGKMVIPPSWDDALSFADGLAPVQKDGKWGYIDKTGKVVVELTWNDAKVFSGGAATVVKNGKFGFIDATGKVISEPKWAYLGKFFHGLAVVNTTAQDLDGTVAVINLRGETVVEKPRIKNRAFPIWITEHGISVIDSPTYNAQGSQIGEPRAIFMNSAGKVLFEQSVESEIEFHEGLAAVWVKKDQLAFIDPTGAIVIAPFTVAGMYDGWGYFQTSSYRFSEGLAVVPRAAVLGESPGQEITHGYMDRSGKMVIPARWVSAGAFSEGLALVSESKSGNDPGTWSIIDKTGTIVAPVEVKTRTSYWSWGGRGRIPTFQNGLVPLFGINGSRGMGYIDRKGKVAIPPVFEFENVFQEGMAFVGLSNLRTTDEAADRAIIDTTGAVVVPLVREQSNRIRPYWNGPESKAAPIPAAGSARRYGLINQLGKVVVPPTWDDAEILSPDLVAYRVNGKFGMVNATGQVVMPATSEKIEAVTPLSPNLIGIRVGGKFGLLNAKGEVVLPATIENIQEFQYHDEQSVSVCTSVTDWGLLEIKTGKITPTERPKFANEEPTLPDDVVPFQENELWGLKAKDGTVLVAAQFGRMSNLAHGAAMVWSAKESGLINTKGEWIFKSNAEVELCDVYYPRARNNHFKHGLALIETPLKWGFVKLTQAAK